MAQSISLPGIFRDHMVLQRDMPVPVWGRAKAGAAVAVSFAGQTKTTWADDRGNWTLQLDPLPASSEPREMRVGDFVIRDVLVGEVWLCSGQSNMRWIVGRVGKFPGVEGADEEIARPESPGLRLFSDDGEEMWQQRGWQRAGGEQVARFSATAYFFGQMLHGELGVPVGVINVSRGGTSVQAWTRREFALRNPFTRHYVELEGRSRDIIRDYNAAQRQSAAGPSGGTEGFGTTCGARSGDRDRALFQVAHLYDAHIEPLAPFAVRGVVWYQGESNAGRLKTAQAYGSMLQDLIEGWRDRWGQPEMPWLVMQLPCWDGATSGPWPWVRQGQWEVARTLSNVSLATTCDVSDSGNLHPAQKREAGQRLARLALAGTYGNSIVAQGPSPKKAASRQGEFADRLRQRRRSDRTQRQPLDRCRNRRRGRRLSAGAGHIHRRHRYGLQRCGQKALCRPLRLALSSTPSLFNAAGLPAAPFALWIDQDAQTRQGTLPSSFTRDAINLPGERQQP